MDKRYKFIRSKDRFEGLEDYKNSPAIKLKEKNLVYPIQKSVFQEIKKDDGYGLRYKEGYLYELISYGIYGGHFKKSYHRNGKNPGDVISSEPDISDNKKGILREIKAVAPGSSLKLRDTQIAKYVLLQTKNYFTKNPEIRFDVFRHGIRGIQNNYKVKGIEEMVKDLSQSTKFSLSLPFSVVFEIYSQDNGLTSRYDGPHYDSLTWINSKGLNQFIAYPEETLHHFGFNPDDFHIEKKKFPSNVKVNGDKMNSFPMLYIYDKNYGKFASELEERINSNEKLSERMHDFTKGLVGSRGKSLSDFSEEECPPWLKPLNEEAPF